MKKKQNKKETLMYSQDQNVFEDCSSSKHGYPFFLESMTTLKQNILIKNPPLERFRSARKAPH